MTSAMTKEAEKDHLIVKPDSCYGDDAVGVDDPTVDRVQEWQKT
jgi:hypothetical protein